MEILTAFNQMLIASGEAPVESLDGSHPLHTALLQVLEDVSTLEQSKGWWFNEYKTTLTPDGTGRIELAADVVRIQPLGAGRSFVRRGNFLLDRETRSDVFDKPITVLLTERWDFEDLPPTFAQYVAAMAALQAGSAYDADQLTLQSLLSRVDLARMPMMKEHVDNSRVNLFETPSMHGKLLDVRMNRYGVAR